MSDDVAMEWRPHPLVRGVATVRCGTGHSAPPFDRLNLGLNSGDDVDTVRANRHLLQAAHALPAPPRWLRQVHGTQVARIDADSPAGVDPTADASVTSVPGVVLAILTADCLPVLFAARDGSEVAAAHAGWRGLAAGVLEATVAAMQAPADTIAAWLGPAAGPQAYEVGDEVRDAFVAGAADAAAAFVATRAGHWRVDLYALARRRLAAAGVTAVTGGGLCTISDARRFYSYRRDGRTGRQASLVWIAP